MQYHFYLFCFQNAFYRLRRYINGLIFFIYIDDPVIFTDQTVSTFEIIHVSCPDSFLAVNPKLTEVEWSPVKFWHICHLIFSLFLPTGDLHCTAYCLITVSDNSCAIIFRSYDNRLTTSVSGGLQMQCYVFCALQSSGFACLL